jgi:hypothetical protein
MIGAIPVAAVEESVRDDLGHVFPVRRGMWIEGEYDRGKITFRVNEDGLGIAAGEGDSFYFGDPCYVLKNNLPETGDWTRDGHGVGYHGACVASLLGPDTVRAFRLANGRLGLVSNTAYGDGLYDADLWLDDDGYLMRIEVYTGDDSPYEEEDYEEEE